MATRKTAASKAQEAKPKVERVAKQYRHLKYTSPTITINVGRSMDLVVFDEESGTTRAIRHCPNEKSIFVDEQSPNAVVRPIIMLNGLLETSETEVYTQKFIEIHPKYGKNFILVDNESDAKDLVDLEETALDIKQEIRKKAKEETGVEELRLIVSVLTSDEVTPFEMSPSELKNELYGLVDENVNRFLNDDGEIDIFDNPDIQRQALTNQAFSSGVIRVTPDGSKIIWSDNKATICMVPTGLNHKEFFSEFLSTDKGIEVFKEIPKRM